MGAFIVNFHVQTDSAENAIAALRELSLEKAWLAGPNGKWVSFWEQYASCQDDRRIRQLAEHVSRSLEAPVIAFLVHDSDFLCYWLYDKGILLDVYNSCPGYFGDGGIDAEEEHDLKADCELLAKYCRSGIAVDDLEATLAQWSQAAVTAGEMRSFVFAEDRLAKLASCLDLPQKVACTDFNDIGRDVMPGEMHAVWIGSGTEKEPNVEEVSDAIFLPLEVPPLYKAAMENDVAAIECLIAAGVDINEVGSMFGYTALGAAAGQASPATLRRMVELGADINLKVGPGESPLLIAIHSGKVENIRTLLELGAAVDEYHPEVGTLLHWVMISPHAEIFQLLLEHGADPHRTNPAGFTPLAGVQHQKESYQQIEPMLGDNVPPQIMKQIRETEESERVLKQWIGDEL